MVTFVLLTFFSVQQPQNVVKRQQSQFFFLVSSPVFVVVVAAAFQRSLLGCFLLPWKPGMPTLSPSLSLSLSLWLLPSLSHVLSGSFGFLEIPTQRKRKVWKVKRGWGYRRTSRPQTCYLCHLSLGCPSLSLLLYSCDICLSLSRLAPPKKKEFEFWWTCTFFTCNVRSVTLLFQTFNTLRFGRVRVVTLVTSKTLPTV